MSEKSERKSFWDRVIQSLLLALYTILIAWFAPLLWSRLSSSVWFSELSRRSIRIGGLEIPIGNIGIILLLLILAVMLRELIGERQRIFGRLYQFWYLGDVLRNRDIERRRAGYCHLDLRRKQVGTESGIAGERQDLVEALRSVVDAEPGDNRALVLGEPGSGKTTGLQRLTWEMASGEGRWSRFTSKIPVLVEFRSIGQRSIRELVGNHLRKMGATHRCGEVLAAQLDDYLRKGKLVLLFDALDQALGEQRDVVVAMLADFLKDANYQKTPCIITTRTAADPEHQLGDLQRYEVLDLSNEAVRQFIKAYVTEDGPISDAQLDVLFERLDNHELLEDRALGRNPFWLITILETRVFEENRGQLLREAVEKAIFRELGRSGSRRWHNMPFEEHGTLLAEEQKALAKLGYEMTKLGQVDLKLDKALKILQAWCEERLQLKNLGFTAVDTLALARDASVLIYDPEPVAYRHQLLREFFAGLMLYYDDSLLSEAMIEECAADDKWWQPMILLVGVLEQEKRAELVRRIVGPGRKDDRLFLAAACEMVE